VTKTASPLKSNLKINFIVSYYMFYVSYSRLSSAFSWRSYPVLTLRLQYSQKPCYTESLCYKHLPFFSFLFSSL
jgi:hypothetical protein